MTSMVSVLKIIAMILKHYYIIIISIQVERGSGETG